MNREKYVNDFIYFSIKKKVPNSKATQKSDLTSFLGTSVHEINFKTFLMIRYSFICNLISYITAKFEIQPTYLLMHNFDLKTLPK